MKIWPDPSSLVDWSTVFYGLPVRAQVGDPNVPFGCPVAAEAMRQPKRFAALVPICGGGDSTRACLLKDVPVWIFHGACC